MIGEGSRGPRGDKEPVIGSRDERYNLERQLAAVRAILRDCGFSSGAQVAAIVKRIEGESGPRLMDWGMPSDDPPEAT